MKAEDLKALSVKLVEHIQKSKTEDYYQQFLQALANSLRNNRQVAVSDQKKQLLTSLGSFDSLPLTYSETNLFAALRYNEYVGTSAVEAVEAILYDSNFDPQGVLQKIESRAKAFQEFATTLRNLQTALKQVPSLQSTALRSGEALLEITFTKIRLSITL